MKIVLITGTSNLNLQDANVFVKGLPPYLDLLSDGRKANLSPPIPQLGVVALASFLSEHGFYVDVFDFSVNYEKMDKLKGYDLIGISSTSLNYDDMVKLCELSKSSNSMVIAGGQRAAFHKTELVRKRMVDGVVVGEGELAMLKICMRLQKGEDISGVPGLYTTKSYAKDEHIENLDSLPLPKWDFLDLGSYIPTLPIQSMRGCPYSCAYCMETRFWDKPVRLRQEKHVVKEIKNNVDSYGIKTFRFVDSCFTAFPERTKRICDIIREEALGIQWTCYARADTLSAELVQSMSDAGCIGVDIGAESGSDVILQKMFKNSSSRKIRDAIRICKNAGMLVHTNFIIGFPGETKETIADTVSLIKESRPTTYCFNPLFVYPGTKLYEDKEKYGLTGKFERWKHKTMSCREVERTIHSLFKHELASLDDSHYFFGGEHAANVLCALGYDKEEIKEIYRSFNELCFHNKKWVIKQLLLSKIGFRRFKSFFKGVRDLRAYA